MKSNLQNTILNDNIRDLDNNLSNIEKTLEDLVKVSVQQIKDNPTQEKQLISLWASHANKISNFFFNECQITDNKQLYKNIIKYMLFNK
ncbi:hypothetical protein [Clostridium akagii]|uniref:hypothetical protein n=1 Tax=Clostridium akagii TaxID=91623 RepID=UPI00047E6A08|nr:hypothetical protein [Clostridium akagii]